MKGKVARGGGWEIGANFILIGQQIIIIFICNFEISVLLIRGRFGFPLRNDVH